MKFVLLGRVVTMDQNATVIANGAVYVDGNTIVAVADRNAPPPASFTGALKVETSGAIFPGLIELHNHLSYDALTLWQVPKKFTNRGQWQSNADYDGKVSGPMGTIAKSNDPHLLASLARYVETKCLLGGVTTSQGISLKGDHLQTYYRSAMRVVDDPNDPNLPRASTRIPDVIASSWTAFKTELDKASCMLLHLSEGLDPDARNAFLALKEGNQWAIGPALAGIHCAALKPEDFAIMKEKGGSVVWSPLSNLLLYGGTTDIKSARSAGVPVAMATSAPASIVKWDKLVGSIAPGKRADFLVIAASAAADPYASLIDARETDVALVLIDGRAVLGTASLMSALGQTGENLQVGSQKRVVNYGAGDPRVPTVTFAEATVALADALHRLPTLLDDENPAMASPI